MTTCSKCGKEIVWIKTPNKNNMPCDPGCELHVLAEGVTVVTALGNVFKGKKDTPEKEQITVRGYIPHWSSCPFSDEFRKKK